MTRLSAYLHRRQKFGPFGTGAPYAARSRRVASVTSRSEPSTRRPGAGGIGSSEGTASTRQPAAAAEATPFGESSSATQRAGSASSSLAASRYGSGSGLVAVTSS